jgi:hypothetical protein
MSFVPAPQQASAAANLNNAAFLSSNNAPFPITTGGAQPGGEAVPDQELIFKIRTFDVYWVEKNALMYKDGIAKVSICFLCCSLACWHVGWDCFLFRTGRRTAPAGMNLGRHVVSWIQ